MQFNSYYFILLFLPISLLGYFTVNRCKQMNLGNLFLVLSSLVFYGFAGKECVTLLIVGICFNFSLAFLMNQWKKHRILLLLGISGNVFCYFILNIVIFSYLM